VYELVLPLLELDELLEVRVNVALGKLPFHTLAPLVLSMSDPEAMLTVAVPLACTVNLMVATVCVTHCHQNSGRTS
jgi:hypothetical protein